MHHVCFVLKLFKVLLVHVIILGPIKYMVRVHCAWTSDYWKSKIYQRGETHKLWLETKCSLGLRSDDAFVCWLNQNANSAHYNYLPFQYSYAHSHYHCHTSPFNL